MNVALTGATGFIGSHILSDLLANGHQVTALVRDDAQARSVADRGATPVVVDLYDRPAVVRALVVADGAIHTASPGDATSADLDGAVVGAVIEAFDGTGKPYIQIGDFGYTGTTPPSTRARRSMRRRWWPGRNRLNVERWRRRACAPSCRCAASRTVTAEAEFPASSSVRRETMVAA